MIRANRERMSEIFLELVQIDSPSGEEGRVSEWLRDFCGRRLGMDVREDDTESLTGSDTGNLVASIKGRSGARPLFFNAHMDTVEPGRGVRPVFQDGCFRSEGDTVLGADDKAGIAIILEAMMMILENDVDFGEIELLFTVSEEIGLLGAKAMDSSFVRARHGYALDSSSPDDIIVKAPAAIRIEAEFFGRSAHAGLDPENGINAIQMAARAVSAMALGRIDEDTTANIGVISGGNATNIVPARCMIQGEVRSHSPDRLAETKNAMLSAMYAACRESEGDDRNHGMPPYLQATVREDYPSMNVPEKSPLVTAALEAGKILGRKLNVVATGGGSDANIFNGKGIETVILGTGMSSVHTTGEFISLDDMERTAMLAAEIARQWK